MARIHYYYRAMLHVLRAFPGAGGGGGGGVTLKLQDGTDLQLQSGDSILLQ